MDQGFLRKEISKEHTFYKIFFELLSNNLSELPHTPTFDQDQRNLAPNNHAVYMQNLMEYTFNSIQTFFMLYLCKYDTYLSFLRKDIIASLHATS